MDSPGAQPRPTSAFTGNPPSNLAWQTPPEAPSAAQGPPGLGAGRLGMELPGAPEGYASQPLGPLPHLGPHFLCVLGPLLSPHFPAWVQLHPHFWKGWAGLSSGWERPHGSLTGDTCPWWPPSQRDYRETGGGRALGGGLGGSAGTQRPCPWPSPAGAPPGSPAQAKTPAHRPPGGLSCRD